MCQLQALDSSLALLSNVAYNVCNGIGLVLEVAVGHIAEARRRISLASAGGGSSGRAGARCETAGLAGLSLLLSLVITLLDLLSQVIRLGKRLDEMLHVVALATNETAKVKNDSSGLVTLSHDGHVGVLKLRKLLLVSLTLALKLLSNLLLEDEGLESIVTLLLSTSKTNREAGIVVLLLINETSKTAVLPLVCVDLDLEVLCLFGKGLSEGLEFEELLLPALELLHKVVVALVDLAELSVHATLEVDEVLPSFKSIARVLVPLTDELVEVAHRDLGHEGLLDGSAKDSLNASVASKLLTDVIHNSHDGVLVPPLRVLDRLDLSTHHDDLAGRDKLATTVSGSEMLRDSGGGDIAVQSLSESGNKLVTLAGVKSGGRAGCENEVAIKVDD
ncbi:hypothetical protein HG531_003458 [Fusarium graminearum]|nr:hypothetical protein HG531_003458 [Fusarium graminearum]